MNSTYTGNFVNDLYARCDKVLAESRNLRDQVKRERMERICMKCAKPFGDHCGWDERCPHPRRSELGQPHFIDGQFFARWANLCECQVMQNVEDQNGQQCSKACEPGRTLCKEHYVE